jgi:DNA polymerase-3 subunit delta
MAVSLAAIEAGLRSGTLIWVVLGDVPLFVDRAVARLTEWGRERCGPPQLNLAAWRAGDSEAVAAIAAARTLPMMAALRVVVIREMEAKNEALWMALLAYLSDPSPTTLLVICGAGFPKVERGGTNWSTRLSQALKGKGEIVRFSAEDTNPTRFAQDHARSLGKELGAPEASLIVELVGRDIGCIAREVEKVALFVGDEPKLSSEAIHTACSLLAEPLIWDLTNAIAAKDAALATVALQRMLDGAEATRALLGRIAWQIRQILQIGEMLRAGRSENDIRNALKVRGDAVVRARKFLTGGSEGSAALLARLARANRAMNTARAGDRRILEALVLRLCA